MSLLMTLALMTPFWEEPKRPSLTGTKPTIVHTVSNKHRSHKSPGGNWTKPGKWCGWFLRRKLGIKNPAYNRAIHWMNYGSPTSARVGAVVVWRHHVGLIVGSNEKGWLILSGNDSNRVRTRNWNLKGVVGYRI